MPARLERNIIVFASRRLERERERTILQRKREREREVEAKPGRKRCKERGGKRRRINGIKMEDRKIKTSEGK